MGQKRPGKNWSPVCWRQLKMWVYQETSVAKRGLVVECGCRQCNQGKAGMLEKLEERWRRPSTSPNMLSIWQNPRLNKKSSRTLHSAALTPSALPTKWDVKPWVSKGRNLSVMMLGSCAWTTGPSKLPGKNTMSASQMFDWDPYSLTEVYSLEGPPPPPPHPIWAGDQCHQADEIWQGCGYIPDHSWNAESLWSWRGSADLLSHRGYHPFWEDPYWMGGEHHHVPPKGQGCHPWMKKLSRPQIARPGHEGSREGGWELSMTTSVHRWHAVWLHVWTQHHRRHIHCMPVTRKVLCCQQDTVHGLCGNGIWLCTQTCHLVDPSQARRWGAAGAAHTGHAWKCQKQTRCWLQPEWRIQCESGRSSRLLPEPLTVHHASGRPLSCVSYRMSMGKPVCRWPGHHHYGGIAREADPLKDQHGRKGTSGQHKQNQGPDIWAVARCASEVWLSLEWWSNELWKGLIDYQEEVVEMVA